MQRPTSSGRRHSRAGSVSVAELIRKQRIPLRIPSREQAATQGLVTDLLGEPAHQAVPRSGNRAAKIAGLTTGALVLVASVAAASILAGHRSAGPTAPSVSPPAEISGSSALRPDVLADELGDTDTGVPAPPRAAPLAADTPVDTPLEAESPVVPPREAVAGSKPQVDVVRQFYELLPAKPADAARLLTPELVGGSAQDFVVSWDRIQAITIESTVLRPDGTVLAVVSMQELTGRWIRVEQRFWLTETSPPRIVGTEVLSAQRG